MKSNEEYLAENVRCSEFFPAENRTMIDKGGAIKALQALREDMKRAAFECSQEMMKASQEAANAAETSMYSEGYRKKKIGEARGWKYAAYNLREAFGLPKSTEPDFMRKENQK